MVIARDELRAALGEHHEQVFVVDLAAGEEQARIPLPQLHQPFDEVVAAPRREEIGFGVVGEELFQPVDVAGVETFDELDQGALGDRVGSGVDRVLVVGDEFRLVVLVDRYRIGLRVDPAFAALSVGHGLWCRHRLQLSRGVVPTPGTNVPRRKTPSPRCVREQSSTGWGCCG